MLVQRAVDCTFARTVIFEHQFDIGLRRFDEFMQVWVDSFDILHKIVE
jgi:hypothetical protein